MKLLIKTSLYYLLFSIPILILSGFICYYVITKEVKESNNELLLNRKIQIEEYLKNKDTIPLKFIIKSNEAQIHKIKNTVFENGDRILFSDTLILDKTENEMASHRMITSITTVGETNYQIKIWRSTLEFEELIEGISSLLFVILFLLFLVSLLINLWVSKTLWRPFNTTLNSLKAFRASGNEIPDFERTSIKEFAVLNETLIGMMDKMILDYNSQKRFTENAAHEIQTPIAVIKTKIDLLIQSENLKDYEMKLIVGIDDACAKLTRLNQSLLLLTKIENRQFKTTQNISIAKKVDNTLELYEDHIKEAKIVVFKNIEKDFILNINSDLCLILINNLLQNAIRHNIEGGSIIIHIKQNSLAILNSGNDEPLDTSQLFERFQKKSASNQSMGLGLAITKEIAEVSGLQLDYSFVFDKHRFTLSIPEKANSLPF